MNDTTMKPKPAKAAAPVIPMFEVPKFEMPKFEMPKFDLPKFDMPKLEVPAAFREIAEKGVAQAKDTYEKVKAKGAQAILVQADMGQDADCKKLAAETLKAWGRIDGLVNNAGTTKFQSQGDLDGVSPEDFDRILADTVKGEIFADDKMADARSDALRRNLLISHRYRYGKKCQPACKPGSVWPAAFGRRT